MYIMENNECCENLFSKYLTTLQNTGKLVQIYEEMYTTDSNENLSSVYTFWRNTSEPRFCMPDMPKNLDPEMCNFSSKLVLNDDNRLVARDKIERGEILLMEKAILIAAGPNNFVNGGSGTSYRCHHCRRPVEYFVTCDTCDIIIFCGYKCRYFGWNEYHRWECYGLQRQLFHNQDISYVAMRMVFFGLQFEDGATSQAYYCNHHNLRHFWNMPFDTERINSLMCNIINVCLKYALYLMANTAFFEWLSTLPKFKNMTKYQQLVTIGGRLLRHHFQAEQNIINLPHFHDQVYFQGIDNSCAGIYSSLQFFTEHDHPNTIWFTRDNYIIVKAAKIIYPKQLIRFRSATEEHNMCVCDKCLKRSKLNTLLCLNNCTGKVWPAKKLDYTLYLMFKRTKTMAEVDDSMELVCLKCDSIYPFMRYKILLANAQDNIEKYFRSMDGEYLLAAKEIYKKILNRDHLLFAGLFSLLFQAVLDQKVDGVPYYFGLEYCRLVDMHYGRWSKNLLLAHLYVLHRLAFTCTATKRNTLASNFCVDIAKKAGKTAELYCMYQEPDLYGLTCRHLESN